MAKISIIAGTRPNFIKIAPIIHAIEKAQKQGYNLHYRLIHTGQHYDKRMSEVFFNQLNIPKPNINLNVGGGSHAYQTANIMIRFEQELLENPTNLVLVVGDVNSTMACAITAKKLQTKVAHVEGGIRSGNIEMPEEVNRIVTDSISDYFFTTSSTANENLEKEGISKDRIFFVGNTMIDTLFQNLTRSKQPVFWSDLNLKNKAYLVLTLHRPMNVDNAIKLQTLIDVLVQNSRNLPIIFPVHPRTLKTLKNISLDHQNLHLVDPMAYLQFIYLIKNAKAVITDSGGISEETTVLNIPCMTLRNHTERPETVNIGTNELLGTSTRYIPSALNKLFEGKWKKGKTPPLWNGKTSERIVDALMQILS